STHANAVSDRLGLLLPETNRVGAKIVASDLGQMARCYVNDVQFEFLVYPEDDEVANNSIEFQSLHFLDDEELDSKSEADCIEQAIRGHGVESSKSDVLVDSAPTPLWKRIIDVFGASLGLVLLSPVFAVAAFAVKLSGPGPVLFRQLREGKDGRPFEILKFRTMCDEAESIQHGLREFSEQDGPAFKLEKDPRLTKVGKYLRVTCIDELPQLVNVLLGQMSLVGPRPLPVSESVECLIWQRRRLQVVPGITCIWQLQGDRTTKFEDWMRMDMEYIRKRSFWFDLQLILKTVGKVLLHRGSV
ncbi:MAG: sugar transferase, partial [Planctomycetota bacterium]